MDASSTGDVSALGDVRTWFFLILGILMSIVAYIAREDRKRLDKHDERLNNHSQRLTGLDGKIEDE